MKATPRQAGKALLAELMEFATQRQFVHAHRWRVNDVVMWDNRCTMRRGRPFDDQRWKRDAQRATVEDGRTPSSRKASACRPSASPQTRRRILKNIGIHITACALAAGLTAVTAQAQPLPSTTPGAAGFSTEGLERLDRFFAREIEAKRVPGAVVAIARDGKLVHYKAYGVQDPARNTPMPLDAVVRAGLDDQDHGQRGGAATQRAGTPAPEEPPGRLLPRASAR